MCLHQMGCRLPIGRRQKKAQEFKQFEARMGRVPCKTARERKERREWVPVSSYPLYPSYMIRPPADRTIARGAPINDNPYPGRFDPRPPSSGRKYRSSSLYSSGSQTARY
mmetsp:Transcript_9735/g.14219  ORF Transcript_9735/g.14219 Transcript_9735/m.14219 type:complete len:110 (-) Transcript_9735:48-377(-)